MKKNIILKYLLPVIAVVVVIQSLVLINNLNNKSMVKNTADPIIEQEVVEVVSEENEQKDIKPTAFDIEIVGNQQMQLGKLMTMEVKSTTLSDRALDSINVYLKYNPQAFDITNLVFDKRLPNPTFSKVSTAKGMVVVNFLISAPSGVKVTTGDVLSLIKFNVKPNVIGAYDFEISTGNEMKESATMFVENATSEILPFTSNKLTVNVVR